MHILLLGATGRNGHLIAQSALSRSHTIVALVRDPSTATLNLPSHPNLTLIRGNPTSQPDLLTALHASPSAPQAVIIALGHRRLGASPFAARAPDSPADLLALTATSLIAAVRSLNLASPPKMIINSSLGVGSSWSGMSLPFRFVFSHASSMKLALEDHARVDALVRESGMPFVLARAAALKDGDAAAVREWDDNGKGAPWIPSITRESLAEWLVDAAEKDEWDGRAPVITN